MHCGRVVFLSLIQENVIRRAKFSTHYTLDVVDSVEEQLHVAFGKATVVSERGVTL